MALDEEEGDQQATVVEHSFHEKIIYEGFEDVVNINSLIEFMTTTEWNKPVKFHARATKIASETLDEIEKLACALKDAPESEKVAKLVDDKVNLKTVISVALAVVRKYIQTRWVSMVSSLNAFDHAQLDESVKQQLHTIFPAEEYYLKLLKIRGKYIWTVLKSLLSGSERVCSSDYTNSFDVLGGSLDNIEIMDICFGSQEVEVTSQELQEHYYHHCLVFFYHCYYYCYRYYYYYC